MQPAEKSLRWSAICRDQKYRGQWLALDQVRYENGTVVEGRVVDVDGDLAALCARVQAGAQGSDTTSCAILFCDDGASGIRRTFIS